MSAISFAMRLVLLEAMVVRFGWLDVVDEVKVESVKRGVGRSRQQVGAIEVFLDVEVSLRPAK